MFDIVFSTTTLITLHLLFDFKEFPSVIISSSHGDHKKHSVFYRKYCPRDLENVLHFPAIVVIIYSATLVDAYQTVIIE